MENGHFCRGFDAQVNGGMLSVRSFRRDFGYYYNGEPVLPASWQSAFNTVSLFCLGPHRVPYVLYKS